MAKYTSFPFFTMPIMNLQAAQPEKKAPRKPASRDVKGTEDVFAQDGNQDHQERELGDGVLFVSQQQARGDGGSAPGKPRQDGQALGKTDDEGVAVGDFPFPATQVGGQSQQQGCDYQHATYQQEASEQGFHVIFEEKADDHDRDHRNENLQDIVGFLVHFEFDEPLEKFDDLVPENDNRAKDRRTMDDHGEQEVVRDLDAQQGFSDFQMPAAADRQKLGQSLDDTED